MGRVISRPASNEAANFDLQCPISYQQNPVCGDGTNTRYRYFPLGHAEAATGHFSIRE